MDNELAITTTDGQELLDAQNENQIVRVVRNSGLDTTKAQILLEKFNGYFEIAASWEAKAAMLQITSIDQVADMKTAREGRLFLKDKRVSVEKTRKALKETSLRESQTIDAIARILTNLITPIEQDLEDKERFAEIFEANRQAELSATRILELAPFKDFVPDGINLGTMDQENYLKIFEGARLQSDAKKLADEKAEQQRIQDEAAQAEADRIELQRIQDVTIENARLKAISDAREKELQAERTKATTAAQVFKEEVMKAAAKAAIEKEALLAELERAEKAAAKIAQDAKDKEAQRLKDQAAAERKAKAAPDKVKLLELAEQIRKIQAPEVKSEEAQAIIDNAQGLLLKVRIYIETITEKL